MKLYMVEDEKYPHIFVKSEEEIRQRDAVRAESYRKNFGKEMPADYYRDEDDFRVVPDHLGKELIALRKREAEILQEIGQHLHDTGQAQVEEDWEPVSDKT